MGIVGKLVSSIDIKSDGDVFHEIVRDKPHHISTMSPDTVQNCDLHEGEFGKVGCVVISNYFHDGKPRVAKEVIEAIDAEKISVTYMLVEGDLKEDFNSFKFTVHVDTNGDDNLVTWTFDYEKKSEDVPEPNTLMDFCLRMTKDIETHHLSKTGIVGKLVSSINIKSDGDVFHELFREKPHHISTMSPDNIQNCDLHEGEFGKVGCVVVWNYFHDGKPRVAKEVIKAIDEEKKSITYTLIEGDLKEQYNSIKFTIHVDTTGDDNLVTWTFDYEKKSEDVPEPNTLMDFCLRMTKDIETHHLSTAN